MAATKHGAYVAIASALTTQLNALANNANSAASAAIDNSSTLHLFVDLELFVNTTTARAAGAQVLVYMTPALDGTNYDDVNETTADLVAVFTLDAVVTARRMTRRDIPVPPGLFKFFVRNAIGVAFGATGTTLRYRFHSVDTS
jgi:hypothetical protein